MLIPKVSLTFSFNCFFVYNHKYFALGHGDSRVFITTPRVRNGIPITLGVVEGETSDGTPLVQAYPNYQMQCAPTNQQCDEQLISVFRIAVSNAFL
jgi:hypothetical protein